MFPGLRGNITDPIAKMFFGMWENNTHLSDNCSLEYGNITFSFGKMGPELWVNITNSIA